MMSARLNVHIGKCVAGPPYRGIMLEVIKWYNKKGVTLGNCHYRTGVPSFWYSITPISRPNRPSLNKLFKVLTGGKSGEVQCWDGDDEQPRCGAGSGLNPARWRIRTWSCEPGHFSLAEYLFTGLQTWLSSLWWQYKADDIQVTAPDPYPVAEIY